MQLSFLTPLAGTFAAAALLPVAVFVLRERRARRIRRELRLADPPLRVHAPVVLSLALVPGLLGLAAAQPVLEGTTTRPERRDAQVYVVVDTSRSMLASASLDSPTRLERARDTALALQRALPGIPFGIASLTDRVLPHALPTSDGRVYAATLEDSIGIDQPAASRFTTRATSLGALSAIPRTNYFAPSAKKRLLVVLTDGESDAIPPALGRAFQRRPRITVLFVHLWGANERIYATGAADGSYEPDPEAGALIEEAASLTRGRVLAEGRLDDLVGASRAALGDGPTRSRTLERRRRALMPFVAIAALVPLGFLLLKRNV